MLIFLSMEKTKSFSELIVWQKAHRFVLDVYSVSKAFPKDERFGLTDQIRRASVSIAAKIAEGYSKRGVKDKLRFFNMAEGSLSECKYYLILVEGLKYAAVKELAESLDEIHKLLRGYLRGIVRNAGLPAPNS